MFDLWSVLAGIFVVCATFYVAGWVYLNNLALIWIIGWVILDCSIIGLVGFVLAPPPYALFILILIGGFWLVANCIFGLFQLALLFVD